MEFSTSMQPCVIRSSAPVSRSFHSGDHLHPSADGYKAMADAFDVALITSAFQ